jgi:hypothetical protein
MSKLCRSIREKKIWVSYRLVLAVSSQLTVFLSADKDLADKGTSYLQELPSNRESSIAEFLEQRK